MLGHVEFSHDELVNADMESKPCRVKDSMLQGKDLRVIRTQELRSVHVLLHVAIEHTLHQQGEARELVFEQQVEGFVEDHFELRVVAGSKVLSSMWA